MSESTAGSAREKADEAKALADAAAKNLQDTRLDDDAVADKDVEATGVTSGEPEDKPVLRTDEGPGEELTGPGSPMS
ncbi:hypothetical protein FE374_02985 [Georgenia yuyongxinii]|uniref:Uncharacterized protein n=1 Tax=Georgenia yuyongxinii TaxID=2589797 RepID=A0A5B8BZP6_9MICO|nr:hypothetical protein [Georgenia yuyongxinii]QDC23733.1 hypothetical protein FE374_02985 [Georgenia yuyongxinii]